jgi:hypothetical protein
LLRTAPVAGVQVHLGPVCGPAAPAGTDTHPNDAMFLQPDGNLVIYGSYGTVLWKTGTDN